MAESSPSRGPARETRLLLLTLLVSVAVLFLLARFRFPERPITDLSPPEPLSRLARPAAFDELSAALGQLLNRFDASVVVLHVNRAGSPAQQGDSRSAATTALVPALRVRDTLALAALAPDDTVVDEAGENQVVARDELRGLAMVRVPAKASPAIAARPQSDPLDVPGYVAVFDAAPSGPIVRAEFVSSLVRAPQAGGDETTVLVGGVSHARPGALLVSLDGQFAGLALEDRGGAALVVPAESVMAQVDRLARGESVRVARPGFTVQALTPTLAKATGAAGGVVVSRVTAASANGGESIAVGDVITAVDGQAVRSLDDWQRRLVRPGPGPDGSGRPAAPANAASAASANAPAASVGGTAGSAGAASPGTLKLDVTRFGKSLQIALPLATPASPFASASASAKAMTDVRADGAAPTAQPLGATFRTAAGGTLDVITLQPDGPASRGGLRPGDRITAIVPTRGGVTALRSVTGAHLSATFASLKSSDSLLLAIDREGQPALVAIGKP